MEELSLGPGERLYDVQHVTRYDYDGDVSLSLQAIRLTPRFRRFVQEIETSPTGSLRFLRDAFENPTYSFQLLGETGSLEVSNHMRVVRSDANPFDFLLNEEALSRPIQYSESERTALAAYFDPEAGRDPVLRAAASEYFPDESETVSFLAGVNTALHQKITYEPRDEPGIYSPAELMDRGKGSCRDYAAFLQKVLQVEGLATRFVSGYLLETGDMQGAEAMHAWAEIYLPGAGWIGLDPTNGVLTDDAFVACAVAINPEDTTPVGGRYFARSAVCSHLTTRLQIEPVG